MPTEPLHRAAFIDRDGVINREFGYVHRVDQFELLPGVLEGLRMLQDAGYRLVVVTNQAGVAHGYYDEAAIDTLHAHMQALFDQAGVHLVGIYHCPHHPKAKVEAYRQQCHCRKPEPGMLLQAAQDLKLDLSASVLVGDKVSDIQAGTAAGVPFTVMVESGHDLTDTDKAHASMVAPDLLAAAQAIVQRGRTQERQSS